MSKDLVEMVAKGIILEVLGPDEGQEILKKFEGRRLVTDLQVHPGDDESQEEIVVMKLEDRSPVMLGIKVASGIISDHFKDKMRDMTIGELSRVFMIFDSLSKAFWQTLRFRYGLQNVGVRVKPAEDGSVTLVKFPEEEGGNDPKERLMMAILGGEMGGSFRF